MEAYLRAALRVGVDEALFWRSTPYNAQLRIKAAGEAVVAAGWWGERFAREERLSSLPHYLNPKAEDADDGDALIASWGMMHGLEVEDVDDGDAGE